MTQEPHSAVLECAAPAHELLSPATAASYSQMFRAIANPARLQILHLLKCAEHPLCVCELTDALPLSQPTVSHHLARLRSAGLLITHRRGVWTYCELPPNPSPLAGALLALLP
ncbi:MAG: metalloregulator ArsR/SmtB family transcription factor [Chloroflexi bacterium]|nr:metalloregulator ArsR/SmtB family transcription factor [Chloroflexota bacterium]